MFNQIKGTGSWSTPIRPYIYDVHIYTCHTMYTCIHTCIQVYLPTYIHTYIHTHTHTYKHTYIHTNTHTYIYIHTYTYRQTDTHTRTRTHAHAHTHTPTHITLVVRVWIKLGRVMSSCKVRPWWLTGRTVGGVEGGGRGWGGVGAGQWEVSLPPTTDPRWPLLVVVVARHAQLASISLSF